MKRRNFIKSILSLSSFAFIPKIFAEQDIKYTGQTQGQTVVYKKGYPKTVVELTEWMETALPVGKSTNHRYSITGEEYIEYAISQGEINNEVLLCRYMWNTFVNQCQKLHEDGHKLYWRIKPEYKKSRIYTQYLISNKPEKLWVIGKSINVITDKNWKVRIGA